jgi:hypothetical protein
MSFSDTSPEHDDHSSDSDQLSSSIADADATAASAPPEAAEAPNGSDRDDTLDIEHHTGELRPDALRHLGIGEVHASDVTIINGGNHDTVRVNGDGTFITPASSGGWGSNQRDRGSESALDGDSDDETDFADDTEIEHEHGAGRIDLGRVALDGDTDRTSGSPHISGDVVIIRSGGIIGSTRIETDTDATVRQVDLDAIHNHDGAEGAANEDDDADGTDNAVQQDRTEPITDGPGGPTPPEDDVLPVGGEDDGDDDPSDHTADSQQVTDDQDAGPVAEHESESLDTHRADDQGDHDTEATENGELVTDRETGWVPRLGMDTTAEELTSKPSAVNPYPDLAPNGDLEVWREWNPGPNPQIFVHYPQYGVHVAARVPLANDSTFTESGRPQILSDTEDNGTNNPGNWVPITDFWSEIAPEIAEAHIYGEARDQGATDRVGQLFHDNQNPERSHGQKISSDPQPYVRESIHAVQDEIAAGRPEAAYLISQQIFRGFEHHVEDGPTLDNRDTMYWSHDEMPRLLFPDLAETWDEFDDLGGNDTIGDPFDVGKATGRLVINELSGQALDALMNSDQAKDQSESWREKVASLRAEISELTNAAEIDLRIELEATRQRHDATSDQGWQMPEDLKAYVIDRLAA